MKTVDPHPSHRAALRPLSAAKAILSLGLAVCLALTAATAQQTGNPPGCNNPIKPKPCPCDDPRGQGVNPVDAASSDVMRSVRDLEVFGGVGEHQLNWTRHGHSRAPGGSAWFGDGHNWRHNYQWEMASTGSNHLEIVYPDGTVYDFTKSGTVWAGIASNPDLLTQSGTSYSLLRDDGFTYHFVQITSGGKTFFQMQNFTDSVGDAYALTYDSSNRVVLVTEPAGRWLRVTYQSIPVNQSQFKQLAKVGGATDSAWNEITVTDTTAYRYLRYYATDPDQHDAYCDVAEVQFIDQNGQVITGTPFGSSPSLNNNPSTTFDKAFDGDTSTYFYFASAHFGFTGIDLGAGNAKRVSKVRFYPRVGHAGDMFLGRFEGSNSAPVTETVVSRVQAGYGTGSNQVITRTVQYNYTTMADPVVATGWLVLSGATYGDNSQAQYTYQSVYAGQHPLLLSADDPRVEGVATRIKYEFWNSNAYVLGAIYAEHDFASNQVLCKFEGEGGGTYANAGRKITYANGGARHVVMGTDNNATSSMDELGNQTTYNYGSSNGFLLAKTDPLNHTTSYTRDAQGRVLSATYADNSTESWTRDALGHVLTYKDERGYTTTWTRDGNGRATRIDYPDGGYETFTYNNFGQAITHRQTNGGSESFAYDGRGMKTDWTDALSHTTTYGYDANDLLVLVTDPLNHATSYAHNERGQVTQATYADNTATSYAYDAYSNRLSRTNELGKTWSATFDAYKRRITATDPLNRNTQYWYDEPGAGGSGCGGCGSGLGGTSSHLTTLILPSGKTTKTSYDFAWRKTNVTIGYNTSAAATTIYAYDTAGNVQSMTDPRGKVTTYAYDNRNRRTSITDPLSHVTSQTYDAVGNVATDIRADNGVTSYVYDSMGRRSQVTDPLNQVTKMTYDMAGNLATLIDARNNACVFTYDLRNRKTRMNYPDSSYEDWGYDATGNVATYTTRAGQVKTSAYDVRNRETDSAWNDGITPEVATSYDAAGRLLTLNNSNSALTYTYDDAGEFLSETQNITGAVAAGTITYNYNADGNRSQIVSPDGTMVTYAYTTRNQVASISLSGPSPLAFYEYDLVGNRTVKNLENGSSVSYVYDAANRLTLVNHHINGATLASFAYAYNPVNNRSSVTYNNGLGDTYDYDNTDQLTGVRYSATNPTSAPQNPQSTQAYAYDAVGNRTSFTQNGVQTSYSNNNLNEYTQIDGVVQNYDGNGSLIIVNGQTLSYDAQGRLTSALPAGLSIAYDARNRPVKRTINGSSTFLYYDGWDVVNEFDAVSNKGTCYVHGVYKDEILSRINGGGASIYYHHDGLGNVVAVSDNLGREIEHYYYDVFGSLTVTDGQGNVQITGSMIANRFLFTGRELLPGVNIYDYRNRLYCQQLGRFLQVDPTRFYGADINMYNYVGSNPATWIDPSGLVHTGPNNDPQRNHVECQGGVSVVYYGTGNDPKTPQDILDCVKKHEQTHINDFPKDVCQGVPNGYIVFYDNPEEQKKFEKHACDVQSDCLKKECPQNKVTKHNEENLKKYCDQFN